MILKSNCIMAILNVSRRFLKLMVLVHLALWNVILMIWIQLIGMVVVNALLICNVKLLLNLVISINQKDVKMEKFNYQIMFSLAKNQKQVLTFAGETDKDLKSLIEECLSYLSDNFAEDMSSDYPMVQCYYQPINPKPDESKERK